MKILIIGATGMAGSALTALANQKGHTVVANGRDADKLAQLAQDNAGIETLAQDAFTLTKEQLAAYDVVVDAFAVAPTAAYLHIDLAAHLVHELRGEDKPRVAFILGAGSLKHGDHLVVDEILADESTLPWRAVPQAQLVELDFLRSVDNVNWVGFSPAQLFTAGPASDKPLHGTEDILFNAAGESVTTAGTMAVAILAELEQPTTKHGRLTVANG